MGWSESGLKCKMHPDQSQVPGVCSSCLRERLSQLSCTAASHNKHTPAFSFSSSRSSSLAYSSAAASNYASPNHSRRRRGHQRNASDVMSSISFMISGGGYGLKKSRSMANFVRRGRVGDVAGGRKKGGFWSKLLMSTGKRTKEVFMHSRTMRERVQ